MLIPEQETPLSLQEREAIAALSEMLKFLIEEKQHLLARVNPNHIADVGRLQGAVLAYEDLLSLPEREKAQRERKQMQDTITERSQSRPVLGGFGRSRDDE